MKTKIVTVSIVRYYSKFTIVELEVPKDLVGDDLVEFLTEDDSVNEELEDAIYDARLEQEETKYHWQDPTDNNGGTL